MVLRVNKIKNIKVKGELYTMVKKKNRVKLNDMINYEATAKQIKYIGKRYSLVT